MKTTTITVIKLSLKYSPMSEGNTCIAEPNLEALSFAQYSKEPVLFLFIKILNNDVRSYDAI